MSDFDEQDKRVADILLGEDEVPDVNGKTLKTYFDYLKANLKFPCHLTGREDFAWEERYVFGHGSQKEYERLKKTQASYKDTFELLDIDEELDGDYGLFVNVKRTLDHKKFTLPLADLITTDEHSNNYQLFDDYSYWFVNYR
jgi:hypothetical protein